MVLVMFSGCKSSSSTGGSPEIAEAQSAAFHSGFGVKPATPGIVFDGIDLGAPASRVRELRTKYAASFAKDYYDTDHAGMLAMFRDSRVVISASLEDGVVEELGLWTNDERDKGCPAGLVLALRAAWAGAPMAEYEDMHVWLDPVRKVKARLATGQPQTGDQCRLKFERYETIDAWMERAIPLAILGKPAAELARFGVPPEKWKQDGSADWRTASLSFASGGTSTEVEIAGGTIVSIHTFTYVGDRKTIDEVVAKLSVLRGAGTVVEGKKSRILEWKGEVPMWLDLHGEFIALTVGRGVANLH